MNLADFQNPLANMPLLQQMQQSQNTQAQFAPSVFNKTFDDEVTEELTTVKETEEQEEKNSIKEEDNPRGDISRRQVRRRASQNEEESEEDKEGPPQRLSDGIHGNFLDIQA